MPPEAAVEEEEEEAAAGGSGAPRLPRLRAVNPVAFPEAAAAEEAVTRGAPRPPRLLLRRLQRCPL